jgi:hypothetical protein
MDVIYNVMDVIYILGGVPPFLLGLPFSRPPVLTAPLFRLLAMALCMTDQLLESSSVAAPVAVERLNVEASRYSSTLPVGLSRTQSNVIFPASP